MEHEENMSTAGPARKPVTTVDVDRLADQVSQLASSQHLRVVPATPLSTAGTCVLVLLGNNDLSAADFCELAATAGARLLYVQAEGFDAGTDPDLDLQRRFRSSRGTAASDLLAELHRDAQRFNGRIRQLELVFVVGCVLHSWAVAADWYVDLVDRVAELTPHPREQS